LLNDVTLTRRTGTEQNDILDYRNEVNFQNLKNALFNERDQDFFFNLAITSLNEISGVINETAPLLKAY